MCEREGSKLFFCLFGSMPLIVLGLLFLCMTLTKTSFVFFSHANNSHQWIFISDAIRKTVMHSPMGEAMPHALMDRLGKKLFEEAPLDGYASVSTSTAAGGAAGSVIQDSSSSHHGVGAGSEDQWLTENDILEQMSFGSVSGLRPNNNSFGTTTGSTLSLPLSSSSSTVIGTTQQSHHQQQQQSSKETGMVSSSATTRASLKRPMLTMRTIQHVRELEFFLTHVAQYAYHTTYTLAKPDTRFIEALIERDMLGSSGTMDD